MLDRDTVREVVYEKVREKGTGLEFLSDRYLNMIIEVLAEALEEACIECSMTKGDIKDG